MRNSTSLKVLLILLGLTPIVAWGFCVWATVLSYRYPASTWSSAATDFGTIVLVLTPALIGGILMIVGAALLGRRPLGARVVATIGIVLAAATVAVFVAFEGVQAGSEMLATAAAFVLLHAGVLAWLWCGRRRAPV